MPDIAPPPPLRSSISPEIELTSVSFFGHSLAEYAQFFGLDLVALKGRDVLDVAAGPSSFTAEACARKINAVAVDPHYTLPASALAAEIARDYEGMLAQMRATRRFFRLKSFPSFKVAELERRTAAQRFLNDYETHFIHNRYIAGSVPRLPFFDETFDLVLCAHLLFTSDDRFNFEWHLAASRELVRVSAGEVRIHPLCGLDGKPYAGLARLRRELRAAGIVSTVVPVDYAFFAGATSMLVLRRAGT